MPIELENKYILDLDTSPELFRKLIDQVRQSKIEYSVADFRQGYLNKGTRIRSINWRYLGGWNEPKDPAIDLDSEYFFTYKHKINGNVIEIETEISPEDFHTLWPETKNRLNKTRFSHDRPISDNNEHWEIDFFFNNSGNIYFAVAECELYHGKTEPSEMPDFVKENLLLAKADNSVYSSRKMSDEEYAKKVLSKIKKDR